jgi:hypothetical protein
MEIANDNVLWRRANKLFGRPREQWTTIDEMVYELPDYFNNDVERMEKMRFKAINESLNHHYEKSRCYNQLCKEYDFTPDDVKEMKDLENVPLFPATFFKEYPAENPKAVFEWLVLRPRDVQTS